MEPKLKAELWVKAYIRRCEGAGCPAMVVRRGFAAAGAVLIKVNRLDGSAMVYMQARRGDGALVWAAGTGAAPVPEADAEGYIARSFKIDPDIWVVEVEDREGRHFLDDVDKAG